MPDTEILDTQDAVAGRPIWSGTVSFGLVSVPVNVVSGNLPEPAALHTVSEKGRQLRRKYFRADDDQELEQDDIVRGFEYKKDKFVVLDDDELERLAPERTRDIDLRVFVDATTVDPMYFVRGYFLTPVGNAKAYKLLAQVMEERGQAGIATFVMRTKEYVAAIFAQNGILRLETLRFADEIRSPAAAGLPKPVRTTAADVKSIEGMIARLTKTKLDTAELHDEEAEALTTLAKRKAKAGDDVVAAPAPDADTASDSNVVDLVARLERALKGKAS